MALLLVTTLSAFSQTKNITVSGRVVEDTKEPAIQATVQLLLLPDKGGKTKRVNMWSA